MGDRMGKNEEITRKLAEFQKAAEAYNPPNPPVHPCPACGHCPTCGRGGQWARPYYPYVPYPTITYTTNTGGPISWYQMPKPPRTQ